jgi:ribosomal protein L37AE/L43A
LILDTSLPYKDRNTPQIWKCLKCGYRHVNTSHKIQQFKDEKFPPCPNCTIEYIKMFGISPTQNIPTNLNRSKQILWKCRLCDCTFLGCLKGMKSNYKKQFSSTCSVNFCPKCQGKVQDYLPKIINERLELKRKISNYFKCAKIYKELDLPTQMELLEKADKILLETIDKLPKDKREDNEEKILIDAVRPLLAK